MRWICYGATQSCKTNRRVSKYVSRANTNVKAKVVLCLLCSLIILPLDRTCSFHCNLITNHNILHTIFISVKIFLCWDIVSTTKCAKITPIIKISFCLLFLDRWKPSDDHWHPGYHTGYSGNSRKRHHVSFSSGKWQLINPKCWLSKNNYYVDIIPKKTTYLITVKRLALSL